MRFRFPDPKDENERKQREVVFQRIDAWWKAFAKDAARIDAHFTEGRPFEVPEFMTLLEEIDPRVMWEFGPPLKDGRHRLVITPEADTFLRPLVDEILARAPRDTGFEFYPYRPAASVKSATSMVQGRADVSLDGWSAQVAPNEDVGVDLTFIAPPSVIATEGASDAAVVAAECLLGEHVLDTWIDTVELAEALVLDESVPLASLSDAVAKAIERMRASLPAEPLTESTSERKGWVLELEPSQQPDYPRQKDVFVATTTNLPVTRRWLSGRLFSSARFSRACETFCYLKIDGTDGLDSSAFSDRGDIEDALDSALIEAKLGATYGGGTGLKYSYIELSLRDVDRALPMIVRVLREGNIPKRTWLLFHDSSLRDEWVGIWDDTPSPP